MSATATILNGAVRALDYHGLWTGDHFAHRSGLSVTAAIYKAATGTVPEVFYTDDTQALALITADDRVMEAIAYLSLTLDTQPPTTDGHDDYIEHVEAWAARPAPGQRTPLATSMVIGRISRAAGVATTLAGRLLTPRTPAA